MFEYEEAGGLHDVFLNKHAVNNINQVQKSIFPNFERQMFLPPSWIPYALTHSYPVNFCENKNKKKIFAEKVVNSDYLEC